ncbi:hypothetical protein H7J86_09700 [Mycobacterium hackensackense]|uniref:hypothetical protein n=1 Tax=Mycobacterium hackensackense TaxID=228909 RepID=UPI002265A98C|nr:hypothetical protein [Mycobacterium hackensackense]MCV7252434.1 hypothetical protein [Mycobacterium hackensackense]
MKRILIFVAAVLGAAGIAGLGGFATAAPAQASCAPGFTSIPCTIADNVAKAPAQLAGVGCDQPTDGSGYKSSCGLAGAPGQLLSQGCPPDGDGNTVTSCGLPAVPGQLLGSIATLPAQAVVGSGQIVTAPQNIANGLANAPRQIAGGLAAAPGQFVRAILNGGTDPES